MLYQQALMTGIQALAGTEADRVYDQTYNQVYANEAKKANIRNAMHTANLNLASIQKDKVLTNTKVRMQQDEAEAAATVAAATAGVEGGSVDDILYETERNEAMAINAAEQRADQASEGQLAQIGSGMNSLLAVNDSLPEISYVDDLLGAFSSVTLDDVAIGEAFSSGDWNAKKIFGYGD